MARSLGLLSNKNTLFLLCDVQEKFRTVIPNFVPMVTNIKKLMAAGKVMDIPLIVTEQYPDGLGHTVPEIDIKHAKGNFTKSLFSMATPEVRSKMNDLFVNEPLKSVVLFGIESHVCVEQTAIDLREQNFDVHVVADCSLSRNNDDRHLAFERLRQIGCFITTSENVIFKLLRTKENPAFNEVRKMVLQPSVDTALSSKI